VIDGVRLGVLLGAIDCVTLGVTDGVIVALGVVLGVVETD
tara:strand:- start:1345 stop:1464 length:120 start_codon:yes stop_codon:yes gene_type:complete